MLLAAIQCIGQSKWLLSRKRPQRLADFYATDEASRGPFGAMALLMRLRRRNLLASCGAFIVLASVAVDPFTQQVLSYPLKPVCVAGEASANVPRMKNWTDTGQTVDCKLYVSMFTSSVIPWYFLRTDLEDAVSFAPVVGLK